MNNKLNIKHYQSEKESKLPPLLFVHGGYVDSACWEPYYIPYFTENGVDCYTLDLAGHGHSGGKMMLDTFGLEDYADNIATAVASLPRPPVVVGHSMGALATEIYAERAEAADKVRGVALLSPVPPTGTARSAFFISLFNPNFIAAVTRTMKGDPTPDDVETLTNIYFAPGTNPLYAMQYMSRMQPESQRAVMEMAMLPFRVSLGVRPMVPAMVMGGQQDRVFPFWTLPWTSMLWGELPVVVQGAGHMVMLDPAWEDGAMKILSWIKDL